ncbi:MAG: CvpA family protein [Cytophagaceae bacterium]|nr:CvpA family protein [Cytophagaceae bacterium]
MRKLTKYIVITLAILVAELLHAYAHSFFHHQIQGSSPYKSVAISMLIAVIIFYPVFHFIEKYIHAASEKYVAGTKKVTNNRYIGLILGFAIAVFLLFAAFSQVWYHKNPIIDLKNWVGSVF